MIKFILPIFFLFFSFSLLTGQSQITPKLNEGNALLANFSYGYQFPFSDLKDRFGNNGVLHLGVEYWTPNNFIFGAETSFMFGSVVKEDVLGSLRTAEGYLIGNDRNVADVQFRERGIYAGALFGKLISLSDKNARSGIRVTVGVGLLQHKIRIQDDPQRLVASLTDEYKKGYDRLSNGLAFTQFIGYQLLSTNRQVNLTIGAEVIEGFTQNRRSINYDTRMRETEMRLDILLGFRVTWTLPFYLNEDAGEIIY